MRSIASAIHCNRRPSSLLAIHVNWDVILHTLRRLASAICGRLYVTALTRLLHGTELFIEPRNTRSTRKFGDSFGTSRSSLVCKASKSYSYSVKRYSYLYSNGSELRTPCDVASKTKGFRTAEITRSVICTVKSQPRSVPATF